MTVNQYSPKLLIEKQFCQCTSNEDALKVLSSKNESLQVKNSPTKQVIMVKELNVLKFNR